MTDPAIIAASYAAERNYSHNPDDVIDPSGAVLAIGTEKVDTTTLKDRSPENNNATIKGPMPTEGFIQGRRFDGVDDYLDCGNGVSLRISKNITVECIFSINDINITDQVVFDRYYGQTSILVSQVPDAIGTLRIQLFIDGIGNYSPKFTGLVSNRLYHIVWTYDGSIIYAYLDTIQKEYEVSGELGNISVKWYAGKGGSDYGNLNIYSILVHNMIHSETEIKSDFNTLARLPFWAVNYTDYPDNVTEYTDNLPYSSSIISSGTFKVDDDKLQCVSAGTMTYSASYEFDGSEYIKVVIDGVEYAGTGTITQGNTTVSVSQGSNKITIEMGTGDAIDKIDIQFREEV